MNNEMNTPNETMAPPAAAEIRATDAAGDRSGTARMEARLQRARDYQTIALAKEDALQANLGSINAGLIGIAVRLDESIGRALDAGPATIERIQRVLPSIETHLRVARQVDRLMQIELKAAAPRKTVLGPTPGKPR